MADFGVLRDRIWLASQAGRSRRVYGTSRRWPMNPGTTTRIAVASSADVLYVSAFLAISPAGAPGIFAFAKHSAPAIGQDLTATLAIGDDPFRSEFVLVPGDELFVTLNPLAQVGLYTLNTLETAF